MQAQWNNVAVIGVGLIGGSFAMALKRAGRVRRVVGYGRQWQNLQRAMSLGVIDEPATDYAGLRAADLVLLAAPVGQFAHIMTAIAPHLGEHCLISDAGSTKQDVIACARAHLGAALPRFVPGHPIAGAETSGVDAARADLFRGKNVILTPIAENSAAAVDRIAELWRACGAVVSELPSEVHDRVFAAVSHLPHLLAYALVDMFANRDNQAQLFNFAGAGFRDFTRIASSSPEMWRDICLANRDALLDELRAFQRELDQIGENLTARAGAQLEQIFANAQQARADWLRKKDYGQE